MRKFIKEFLDLYQAQTKESPTGLSVDLPESLREKFGQDTLSLVFDAKDVDENSELVTHGGYVLSTVHDLLQDQGVKTVSRLAERHQPDKESLLKAVHVRHARVFSIRTKKIKPADIVFNFKVTYLSDEKTEHLLGLGIDRHGHIFSADEYYTESVLKKHLTSLPQKGSVELTQKNIELAFRNCLKEASERAELHGRSLQNEILMRLHRSITRIKGYYTAQTEELHRGQPGYEEKRVTIDREYRHKLKEEIDNHRMRIVLKLINYHIVERTEIEIAARLIDERNRAETEIPIVYDAFTGTLDYGDCPSCRRPARELVLLDTKTLACDQCVFMCPDCKKEKADTVSSGHCHVCDKKLCDACSLPCQQCGKITCTEHSRTCDVGQELVCDECRTTCSECEKALCRDHRFECFATRAVLCFEHRVICKQCRKVYAPAYVQSLKKNEKFCPECRTPFP